MCRPSPLSSWLFKPLTATQFTRVGTDEPHFSRRKVILKKYPQIKKLYGPDIRILPTILGVVSAQLALAVWASANLSAGWFILVAWSMGGLLTHWLSLGNHELSHNLCFKSSDYNEALGMLANCAQGLPSCVTFKRYHLEHHYHQGEDVIDVDIPCEWEVKFFNNMALKILWVFLQPAFYAIRPLVVNPKPVIPKEVINFTVVVSFNIFCAYFLSYRIPLFNVTSTLLGMGFHPCAGHFIAEHYTFGEGDQETYSYYGILNWVTFNVGYHNEHHDFPRIPGFRLPQVKKIAPEFYDMPDHPSWTMVIYNYVTRPDMGPSSRVKRAQKGGHANKMSVAASFTKQASSTATTETPRAKTK